MQKDLPAAIRSARELERYGQLRAAEKVLHDALATAGAADDGPLRRSAALLHARVLLHLGPAERGAAGHLLASVLEEAETSGELDSAREAVALQALLAYYAGDLSGAEAGARRALSLAIGGDGDGADPTSAERGRVSLAGGLATQVLGMARLKQGERGSGVECMKLASQIFEQLGDTLGRSRVLDSLGNLLASHGQLVDAEIYCLESLRLKRELGDKNGEAITLGALGRIKLYQGRLDEAEDYLRQDLEIIERYKIQAGVGIVLNGLGQVALRKGDRLRAGECFSRAMEQDTSDINRIHAFAGMARIAMTEEPGSAEAYCEQITGLLEQGRFSHWAPYLALVSAIRGEAALASGAPDEAVPLLELAREGFAAHQLKTELLDALVQLGRAYQQAGKTEQAAAIIQEAFPILDEFGAQERVAEIEATLRSLSTDALMRTVMRRYLPEQYVNSLMEAESPLRRGARKTISVLFSDIRGFTEFSDHTDAQEVTEVLNRYLRAMVPAIQANEGMVDKFIGDGIMALYGAFDEDSLVAERALQSVKSGAAMLEALRGFNETRALIGKQPFRIGIGIATGDAVVGNIGSHAKMDYTAIGSTVNLASRIEGKTKELAWSLLISESTYRLIESRIEARAHEDVSIKGLEKPVTLYAVLAVEGLAVRGS